MSLRLAGLCLLVFITACSSKDAEHRRPKDAFCERHAEPNEYLAVYKDGSYRILSSEDLERTLSRSNHQVDWYEPNYRLRIRNEGAVPKARPASDSNNYELWIKMGFHKYYEQGYFGQGIKVAVVDTGVNVDSPYLKNNWVINQNEVPGNRVDEDQNGYTDDRLGWNFLLRKAEQKDEPNHGTQIAHLIAADPSSPAGAGVAPKAKVLPLDFMDAYGGTEAAAIKAIDYAISRDVQIINNSWTLLCSHLLRTKYKEWSSKNVLLINASGNDRMFLTPQSYSSSNFLAPNYISVGSIDLDFHRARFSNYGPNVLLYTFGVDLVTTGRYWLPFETKNTFSSGTSYSAAIASGAAALIWSKKPSMTAAEVRNQLLKSTVKVNELNALEL